MSEYIVLPITIFTDKQKTIQLFAVKYDDGQVDVAIEKIEINGTSVTSTFKTVLVLDKDGKMK